MTARSLQWFNFLSKKYHQRSDDRQKKTGLQYTQAETHDLAEECERFERESLLETSGLIKPIGEALGHGIIEYLLADPWFSLDTIPTKGVVEVYCPERDGLSPIIVIVEVDSELYDIPFVDELRRPTHWRWHRKPT